MNCNFIFDCYSPWNDRFPIQGSKYLHQFLSEQPREGIDWKIVARPLPSDKCRFMLVERACVWPEYYVLFMYNVDEPLGHFCMLTAAEIGQELGGN